MPRKINKIPRQVGRSSGESALNLDILGLHVLNLFVKHGGATLASSHQDTEHGFLVQPSEPANGNAFAKQVNHLASLPEVCPHPVQRLLVGKGFPAAVALITLNGEIFVCKTP